MNPVLLGKAKIIILILAFVVVLVLGVSIPMLTSNELTSKMIIGRMALDKFPLIDGHNDLAHNLYKLRQNQINLFPFDTDLSKDPIWSASNATHTDLVRMKQGKVGAQFWVAYTSCKDTQYKDAVERTLDQIDVIKRLIDKYPQYMDLVKESEDILDAFKSNKIASLLAVEGGHSIDSRLSVLRHYYDLGVRYMTLTHTCNQPWVDASPIDDMRTVVKQNLTEWGKIVIAEMNRLGMLVDLSHVSYGVMHAVLDVTKAPVIFSHSSAYGVYPHHRNVQDDVLRRLVLNDGIIMVNFYTEFIGGNKTIWDVIDHLNYIKNITGPDHIGIGSDFDGVDSVPVGLEDVSKFPDLFDLLAEDGHGYKPWDESELIKLAGKNFYRVFSNAELVSEQMEHIPPYETLIPVADLLKAGDQSCRTDLP